MIRIKKIKNKYSKKIRGVKNLLCTPIFIIEARSLIKIVEKRKDVTTLK